MYVCVSIPIPEVCAKSVCLSIPGVFLRECMNWVGSYQRAPRPEAHLLGGASGYNTWEWLLEAAQNDTSWVFFWEVSLLRNAYGVPKHANLRLMLCVSIDWIKWDQKLLDYPWAGLDYPKTMRDVVYIFCYKQIHFRNFFALEYGGPLGAYQGTP